MSEIELTIELNFETLVIDDNYEIAINNNSYVIRNKNTKQVLKETVNKDGYHQIGLHGKTYGIHRIVALQWIENDDVEHKIQVDHINHIRDDNRIENLRWVTPSDNQKNQTKHKGVVYDYVDELSDEAFEVDTYNEHEFEDLWFDPTTDYFYLYIKSQYKKLTYEKTSANALRIKIHDINNKRVSISLNKFKKVYNLI